MAFMGPIHARVVCKGVSWLGGESMMVQVSYIRVCTAGMACTRIRVIIKEIYKYWKDIALQP